MNRLYKFSFLLFLLLFLGNCNIQKTTIDKEPVKKEIKDDYIKYFTFMSEAADLYKMKKFKESALKYEDGFKLINNKADTNDRFNAACSFALANNLDKAFQHLFFIANKDKYTNLEHIKNDIDLISLHKDKRWQELLSIIKNNKEILEKDFNQELVTELDTIFRNDQNCRTELMYAEKKYSKYSDEIKKKREKCIEIDSINQIKVSRILDKYGWLGKDVIGEKGNLTLFIILQHSDRNIDMQLKYLPLLKEAVKKGKAKPAHLAMLEDRTRLKQGKKQIYGSQIGKDVVTGKYFVKPIEDPINVDKRREEVGLGKLADYLKNWNINWNPKN